MKPFENETYESWVNRVRMFEHGKAMQRIAMGENTEEVMEDMARRIMEKMLHPVYKEIQQQHTKAYDSEKSRKDYEEKYLRFHQPVADHVDGTIFDKDE